VGDLVGGQGYVGFDANKAHEGVINRDTGREQHLKSPQAKYRSSHEHPQLGVVGSKLFLRNRNLFPAPHQQRYGQHSEGSQVNKQLARQAQIGKGVHRSAAQHPTTGEESRVQNQHKRGDDQRKRGAQAGAALLPQHQAVQRGHQHQPRNVHGVFDRVPVPVAAEVQGFVGPVGPHHYAHAQHAAADKRPGQGRFYPGG